MDRWIAKLVSFGIPAAVIVSLIRAQGMITFMDGVTSGRGFNALLIIMGICLAIVGLGIATHLGLKKLLYSHLMKKRAAEGLSRKQLLDVVQKYPLSRQMKIDLESSLPHDTKSVQG